MPKASELSDKELDELPLQCLIAIEVAEREADERRPTVDVDTDHLL